MIFAIGNSFNKFKNDQVFIQQGRKMLKFMFFFTHKSRVVYVCNKSAGVLPLCFHNFDLKCNMMRSRDLLSVFKFEVCTCISMGRASRWSHFAQTLKFFCNTSPRKRKKEKRKLTNWYWPFCVEYEYIMTYFYIEEVHAIKWCTKIM